MHMCTHIYYVSFFPEAKYKQTTTMILFIFYFVDQII